jgi:hypothetical protein
MGIYRTTKEIEIDVNDDLDGILDEADEDSVNQWVCENVSDVKVLKMLLECSNHRNVRDALNEAYEGGIVKLARDFGLVVEEPK